MNLYWAASLHLGATCQYPEDDCSLEVQYSLYSVVPYHEAPGAHLVFYALATNKSKNENVILAYFKL